MHRNAENKLVLKCKTSNFFDEKTSFLFSDLLRFYAVNEEDFRSDLRATYTRHALKNLCKRLLSKLPLQQLNPQSKKKNEAKDCFLFRCKITQQGKMMTSSKPREMKEKLWLKAQIANRIRA
jgi:hypothetical protein